MSTARMTRSADRIIGGVCSGLSDHLRIPVSLVRVLIVFFSIFGGAGAVFYVWLWATVPNAEAEEEAPLKRVLTRPADGAAPQTSDSATGAAQAHGARSAALAVPAATVSEAAAKRRGDAPLSHSGSPTAEVAQSSLSLWTKGVLGGANADGDGAAPAAGLATTSAPAAAGTDDSPQGSEAPRGGRLRGKRFPVTEILLGGCLLLVGISLLLAQLGVDVPLAAILPTMAVIGGIALAWWQFTAAGKQRSGATPRVLGALTLVAAGVLMFFLTGKEPDAWTIVAASLAVLAGVGVAVSPWLLRLNRELIAERAGRARVEERAEIAAHLHDSVLQTLALIQQKSETGSEISRLARAQERDLREWLFRGPGSSNGDSAVDLEVSLREHAAQLERDFPVHFEIVSVGQSAPYPPEPLIAAAREAMLNAARHAGGTVTVYAEVSRNRLSVDIADRGPGIHLDELPAGRMGIRESILGRMERAGGTARILPGPGGTGTSVRLSLERNGGLSAQGEAQLSAPPLTFDPQEASAHNDRRSP